MEFLISALIDFLFAVLQLLESVQKEPIYWLMYALAGIVVFLYGVVPLMILAQLKLEALPHAIPFGIDEYEWPKQADQLFREASSTLEEFGFEVTEGFFLPSAVDNVKTAGVLLINREKRDMAMIVAMYATPVIVGSLKTHYVEFSTVGTNDHIYDTNNSDQLSAFPTPEFKTVHQLPKLRDTVALYKVHQAIIQRDGLVTSSKSFKLDSEYGGNVIEMLQASLKNEFEDAVSDGYLRHDGSTHYRPTIKGAFLMVWKELWPAKTIRRLRRERATVELLEDLKRQGYEVAGN